MEQVVNVKSRNSMIFVDEYVSIHDSLSLLGTIRLSLQIKSKTISFYEVQTISNGYA